jgi:Flp pilus assembly protein CpaB
MKRIAQLLIGLLSIALAVGAGIYGRNLYLSQVTTYQVPVPAKDIPPYTVLTSDLFVMRDMPRAMETLPYYQTTSALIGKLSTTQLVANLPVATSYAVPVADFRLADASFEVISIPVEPMSAVGGQIKVGDRVNIYQAVKTDPTSDASSTSSSSSTEHFQIQTVAADVLVVDVRNRQGTLAETQDATEKSTTNTQTIQLQILTIAVKPDNVHTILNAIALSQQEGSLLWTTLAVP